MCGWGAERVGVGASEGGAGPAAFERGSGAPPPNGGSRASPAPPLPRSPALQAAPLPASHDSCCYDLHTCITAGSSSCIVHVVLLGAGGFASPCTTTCMRACEKSSRSQLTCERRRGREGEREREPQGGERHETEQRRLQKNARWLAVCARYVCITSRGLNSASMVAGAVENAMERLLPYCLEFY